MSRVEIRNAVFLGGPTGKGKWSAGRLCFNDRGIGVRVMKSWRGFVPLEDVAGISFDSETVGRSRVLDVMTLGVLGFATKSSSTKCPVTVFLKSGGASFYRVGDRPASKVQPVVQPYLLAHGIPILDGRAAAGVAPSAADEIAKLAELHRSGALTDDEFAAHKARLL